MLVFICTPGTDAQAERAEISACCEKELELGNIPIAPQLLFSALDAGEADELWMSLEMLERTDALHVYGRVTPRMKEEIQHARSIGIPVAKMD